MKWGSGDFTTEVNGEETIEGAAKLEHSDESTIYVIAQTMTVYSLTLFLAKYF